VRAARGIGSVCVLTEEALCFFHTAAVTVTASPLPDFFAQFGSGGTLFVLVSFYLEF
jgi:hypothetical protein